MTAPRQRNHDALEEIVDHWLDSGDAPVVNGDRPRIVVTMHYDALRQRLLESAMLDSRLTISPVTARRLACDAEILPVVLGGDGEVLDIGRTSRTWTAGIRRAAWIRDGGRCAFPGCTNAPRRLHHMLWWERDLGPTSLANSVWVCLTHHYAVHERGWRVHRNRDNSYTWTSPGGRDFTGPPARHTPAAAPPAPSPL